MPKKTPPFINYPDWTDAKFFGFLRSNIRSMSRKYPPIQLAIKLARRPYKGDNKAQKWEYQCSECKEWFKGTEVVADHIIPAGSLKSFNDLPAFCERLFCSVSDIQVLCKPHHQVKTNNERKMSKDLDM